MHKNPNQFSEQKSSNKHLLKSHLANTAQHVLSHTNQRLPVFRTGGLGSSEFVGSLLHALPFETLTNVTAWLDPLSLLALGLVDKYLKRYVDNDSTWKTAFLVHFLDVAPEEWTINARMLLLRRIENSWKREYISRYKLLQCVMFPPFYERPLTPLIRRWNRSKATTTTHIPLMLPVTSMHLLNDRQSLVCFSAGFGIAVRTLPANGSCHSRYGRPCTDSGGRQNTQRSALTLQPRSYRALVASTIFMFHCVGRRYRQVCVGYTVRRGTLYQRPQSHGSLKSS